MRLYAQEHNWIIQIVKGLSSVVQIDRNHLLTSPVGFSISGQALAREKLNVTEKQEWL